MKNREHSSGLKIHPVFKHMHQESMITFGPVPSRRLGRSLGINNIPPKTCTYACVYCQLGRTITMRTERQGFYAPEKIVEEVKKRVQDTEAAGESIDYLTFVADGEPTLDKNLHREIELLKHLGIKIAVITNSSLIGEENVRETLSVADWVSLKIDSLEETVWRKINRPHRALENNTIEKGMLAFAKDYSGILATETMLVKDINDSVKQVKQITEFLVQLKPATAYLSVCTRPPAEKWIEQPKETTLIRAYQIMNERIENVEYLIGYEGNAFASTGDAEEDLLSITAVHPMRKDAVEKLLKKTSANWNSVEKMIKSGILIRTEYNGKTFIARKLTTPGNNSMLGIRME